VIKNIRALLKTADIPAAENAARFGIVRSTLCRTSSILPHDITGFGHLP
jgi:hypothetical protein